jgi:hypothetical protein
MSELSHHGEWLSLVDVSGPFLAEPVLKDAFPQGLEGLNSSKRKIVRQAYDEWRAALDLDDPDMARIHGAWIDLVLKRVLELDENDDGDVLKSADHLPDTVRCELPEHGVTLRPDYAVVDNQPDSRPLLLISVYGSNVPIGEALKGDGWPASPAERMVELCRATDVRLGLVTNGEQWMLVDAPVGAVTSFASWYARLWSQEPITLQAFVNLLGIRRFFVDRSEQLPALLDNSLTRQDEVTDALGEQVRRAVEVLIQALDRADIDRNRELLEGVEPAELYEAGLTVMMRIVFLLSAEERGLLLLGDERYESNYAVSALRMQLRGESEEILERRWDAWSRLLSIFRAVYGGIEHEAMRLPALGGSLFDPDRFPFLEGRSKGSRWRIDPAAPLPIDNRTVLYLLDAVQLFGGRTLSYLALDIEQIGHVYEGLLERTVVRAREVTLDLNATKNAKNPWVSLSELDDAIAKGRDAVEELLQDRTGSSMSRVRNDLDETVDDGSSDKLLTACHADRSLRDRVKPYFHLMRTDRWGYPLVYPKGAFMVTTGADRRETGTHYTPKSLTEAIVKETLEPLVYAGPAEGKPREKWVLKSPAELLDLKICDPAMGSGAFLVQVCRWLSERLVESWAAAERRGKAITADGEVVEQLAASEPLRNDTEERLITARRLIAERCLYGVDVNALAVELAKLSIWLVTLAKGRPFGFLDHNFRCGDSLLGLESIEQLQYMTMQPGEGSSKQLFAVRIDEASALAMELRRELRARPIRDIRDVEAMANLDTQARQALAVPTLIADAFISEVLARTGAASLKMLAVDAGNAIEGGHETHEALMDRFSANMRTGIPDGMGSRKPFHWPLEFPEVFNRHKPGFDALIGNPPFMGGRKISSNLGENYGLFIKASLLPGKKGSINLVMFFMLRGAHLVRQDGTVGFIATDSVRESDTREIGMVALFQKMSPFWAVSSQPWPGSAGVYISVLHLFKGDWHGTVTLDGKQVDAISTMLEAGTELPQPKSLASNAGFCSDGVKVQGIGFVLSEGEALAILDKNPGYRSVLTRYIVGDDINNHLEQLSDRWVINFWNMPQEECKKYPELWDILVDRVKPYRDGLTKQVHEACFWKFWDRREEFFDKVRAKSRVLVCSKLSKHLCLTFGDPRYIYSEKVKVFDFSTYSAFSVLQSSLHVIWARTWGSSTGETPAYVGSTCFDTFPFPAFMRTQSGELIPDADTQPLTSLGQQLTEQRAVLMASRRIGLTDAYNLFHDPAVDAEDVSTLRKLHQDVDRAVASAYGWQDIAPDYGFHETKDGVRYTWSAESRAVVLSRLIELNRQLYSLQSSLQSRSPGKKTRGVRGIPNNSGTAELIANLSQDKPPVSRRSG